MAKVIMVQGTSSGAGKSLLSTALCRIFTQDGYCVVPFKCQNMSSNAHTLENGQRMARSQAIAAYACNLQPHTDMNPILLCPNNQGETEVIVCGETWGTMNSLGYRETKNKAFEQALLAYQRLNDSYDIIVVEGAGSPVEMNLIQNDIVNMGLAERINAPVLLVADIVRGGIFASLYGTMLLFTPSQRALVKGMIVNKFKGKIEYFGDGKAILEDLCKVPVLGIIPYTDIPLEDEDSLTDSGVMKTQEFIIQSLSLSHDTYEKHMQSSFDTLADHFRANLDIKHIYEILS